METEKNIQSYIGMLALTLSANLDRCCGRSCCVNSGSTDSEDLVCRRPTDLTECLLVGGTQTDHPPTKTTIATKRNRQTIS